MRLEQSPDGVPRFRRRFVGGKKGRRPIAEIDAKDLREAARALKLGTGTLASSATTAVQALPRIQREDVKNRALAALVRSARWTLEVIKRHGYEVPWVTFDETDDEEE
jgi:hypothetical protein